MLQRRKRKEHSPYDLVLTGGMHSIPSLTNIMMDTGGCLEDKDDHGLGLGQDALPIRGRNVVFCWVVIAEEVDWLAEHGFAPEDRRIMSEFAPPSPMLASFQQYNKENKSQAKSK